MSKTGDYRVLERPSDISYSVPKAVYERPVEEVVYKSNFTKAIEQIYRINALMYLYQLGDINKAKKHFRKSMGEDFLDISEITEIRIKDYSYEIAYKNGEKLSGSISNAKIGTEKENTDKKLILSLNNN